jgi:hypothetical protein
MEQMNAEIGEQETTTIIETTTRMMYDSFEADADTKLSFKKITNSNSCSIIIRTQIYSDEPCWMFN